MTSAGGSDVVTCKQPELVLPKVTIDPETHNQKSPSTPRQGVDSAMIELIRSVQHELRTPLHGMLALLSSFESDMKKEIKESGNEQRMQDVRALGFQVLSILDDFRDYSSHTMDAKEAEEQHEVKPNEEVDLSDLLDDMASEVWNNQVRSLQAARGPNVRIPPPPELILTIDTSLQSKQALVCVDSFRIVAQKLIDNALRFTTGEGYVEISLAPHRVEDTELYSHSSQSSRHYLRLSVEDTGSGMTNEFVSEHLFTPFIKADKFKSGAGLSMALCSALVRKMGGSMQVSSDVGRGTTVIVLLPVNSLPEKHLHNVMKSNAPDQLIYFFRFDSTGLKRLAGTIASQLATWGNLYTTTHIEEADFVLLPEEVCYGDDNDALDELLQQTKDEVKLAVLQAHKDAKIEMTAKRNKAKPPIYVTRKPFGPHSFERLLLLATGDPEDVGLERQDLGVIERRSSTPSLDVQSMMRRGSRDGNSATNGHHTVDLVFTTDMSDQILRGTPPAARLISPIDGPSTPNLYNPFRPKFSALCVEDNPLNMRILTRVLSQCKIPFTMAADGIEAIDLFKKTQPSLILLDINMPRMDGYDAAKELRKISSSRRKPKIIAITALSDDASRKKGLQECGMDEWLCKPLDIIGFKKRLQNIQQEYDLATQ